MGTRHGDGSVGDADYGQIGGAYSDYRRPDPRIAAAIADALGDAASILNVGTVLISQFRSHVTSSLIAMGLAGPAASAQAANRPVAGRQRQRHSHSSVHPRGLRRRHP